MNINVIPPIEYKTTTRRNLPLEKRDAYGLGALDIVHLKHIASLAVTTGIVRKRLKQTRRLTKRTRRKLNIVLQKLSLAAKDIVTVKKSPPKRILKIKRKVFTDFDDGLMGARFRFRTVDDMVRLLKGFQLPEHIKVHTYTYTNQEVLMISLLRLSYPYRWTDVMQFFPGRSRQQLQAAFYWFLDFMIYNWAYLLLNNHQYWKEFLPQSAEALRVKLATLPTIQYRQYYPAADEPGGFSIFGFIDNTLLAMSRPGGPMGDGEQAPRLDPMIQRAWWTGWKKLHGLKWQTVTMANGMEFDVWGPVSVRHNDLFTLHHSRILEKLAALQEDMELKFKIYGDSAYDDDELLVSGAGRGMSSERESIEWRYKDLKMQWKYLDYKHCLKLRRQPLAKIVFVAMLLSNAQCTMYGCETASYFNCPPPRFEEWIAQGPHAHPIPDDNIFAQHMNEEEFDDEDSDNEL